MAVINALLRFPEKENGVLNALLRFPEKENGVLNVSCHRLINYRFLR